MGDSSHEFRDHYYFSYTHAGYFMLPVSSLKEPSSDILLREKNAPFIESLKKEMMENPTGDVQPILCIVNLKDDHKFDPHLKEGYKYTTIGGNNSREALKQILTEKPYLKENKLYSHRLCSVYKPMDAILTLRLASKHNRATSFSHDMTTLDKV